ncbi:unnamed protein product [Rhodiola kirilowii]
MESANIPHHLDLLQEQQQQQLLRSAGSSNSSSSLDASSAHGSWYGASSNSSNHFAWSPNSPHMNVGNRIYQNINAQPYNTRPYTGERDETEDLQIPWSNNLNNTSSNIDDDHHQHQALLTHDQQPSNSNKPKLDLFNSLLFPKFTNMISSNQSSIEDLQHLSTTCYMPNDHFQDLNHHDTKLLIKPALLSPSGFIQPHQFQSGGQFLPAGYGGSSSSPLMPSRGTFSQIFPSVNISNLNNNTQSNSTISGSLDMNLQALDLFNSSRFGDGINHDQSQTHHLGLPKESSPAAFGQQHVQQVAHRPTSSPNKLQPSFHGGSTTEGKRSQTEPKASQASSKKSRSESRACPPFKVRKEKLGDRITALQQLVAPFGKTDTASVLMEAIGYIKFLQNQVETLSVPYMKSSRRTRPMKPTQMAQIADTDGSVESRRDLRSRGLCLVPLSCMSYVTNDDGGGWPSSEYHGAT